MKVQGEFIRGGVLKYKWMSAIDRLLLVVPEILICPSKGMAGHMGIEKTKSRIFEMAIWYNQRNSCEEHVKGCAVCNMQKRCIVARGEQQLFHTGYAFERIHIDIMGPLMETQKGNKYIHIGYGGSIHKVSGNLSIKNQLAETVAGVVVREFVARFGCPLEIHTDQSYFL